MTGPRAWIVGASGAWGRAVALELLRRGFDVLALGRSDVPELAAWAARLGRTWSQHDYDLLAEATADAPGARALVATLDATPDVLVVCAVVTEGDRASLVLANYLAPAALVEAVVEGMNARGSGRVGVFMGQNARLGLRGSGAFSAAQGALWTWCEAFQEELAATGRGVTVTRVIPPRTASATQRYLSGASGRSARLHVPRAGPIVEAILAGKRRAGRRPLVAAAAMLLR